MSRPCDDPLGFPELVAYAAGDGAPEDLDRIEQHLMGCGTCSAAAERLFALTTAIRGLPRPVLARSEVHAFRDRGLSILEHAVPESKVLEIQFPDDVDLIVLALGGLDLTATERVAVTAFTESTRNVLFADANVPFDAARGEVLMTCQRHFAMFPPDVRFEVRYRTPAGEDRVATFNIEHTDAAP